MRFIDFGTCSTYILNYNANEFLLRIYQFTAFMQINDKLKIHFKSVNRYCFKYYNKLCISIPLPIVNKHDLSSSNGTLTFLRQTQLILS